MKSLEILQRQFEDAAKTFPAIMHVIAQRSKDGIDPLIPDMMSPRGFLVWEENRPRQDNERGYPTKHWVLSTCLASQTEWSHKQRLVADIDMFNLFARLASEAGRIVADMDDSILPISKAELWVRDPKEYWLLLLHHLYPPQHNMWFPLKGAEQTSRPAEEGEPYSAILDDVFLKSALTCGELSARVQADLAKLKPAEKEQKAAPEISIQNSNVILGDIHQPENLQVGDNARIYKQEKTEEKKKGIIRKLLKGLIGIIVAAVVTDILGDFGWIGKIKIIIYNIFTSK